MQKTYLIAILVVLVAVGIVFFYFQGVNEKQEAKRFAQDNSSWIPFLELCFNSTTNSIICTDQEIKQCKQNLDNNLNCIGRLAPNEAIKNTCSQFVNDFEQYKQSRELTNEIVFGIESTLGIEITKMRQQITTSLASLGLCMNEIGRYQGTLT